MRRKFCLTFFIIGAFAAAAYGQTAQPTPHVNPQIEAQKTVREQQSRQREFDRISSGSPNAERPRGVSNRRNYFPIKPRRTREQQKRLQPGAEELNRHAAFLGQPKTGLIRLMPDLDCTPAKNVVRADEPCLNYVPGSSFYSFREREYSLEPLSDIRYKDGLLVSDGILSQGFLVNLGDVSPESVTLDSEGMRFLTAYQPATEEAEAVRQYKEMMQGIRSERFIYRKSLPARENSTYALRVIAYRGRFPQVFRGYRFDLLAGDARRDLTVVFRIVRKDEDESVLLLWKELARKPAPKVVYSKKEDKK